MGTNAKNLALQLFTAPTPTQPNQWVMRTRPPKSGLHFGHAPFCVNLRGLCVGSKSRPTHTPVGSKSVFIAGLLADCFRVESRRQGRMLSCDLASCTQTP